MRLIFWVTAFAVLSIATAKNSTAKTKPKRQLDDIRTPQNLQYSLVLPHSRVSNFRQLTTNRRISNVAPRAGKLPPYAVQMEPVVQYSQKDPLYDRNHDNVDNPLVNKNEIFAQPKILHVHDQDLENSFGPPYGGLPTAPLYSHEPYHHYYEEPEPIIEIIIKESNESLPAPPPQPIQKKKKEPVQVFYVKYSKDPHAKDKVIYEKPVPAITPPSNVEDDHHEEYVTVTPEPLYLPTQTTTLRAIIKPESEIYHSDSKVKITFGSEGRKYSNRREENSYSEQKEETAPRPAIALPNQPPTYASLERSASPRPQYNNLESRPYNEQNTQSFHSGPSSQSRLQFQQPYISYDPQLPRQSPSNIPFRALPSQPPRQGVFNHSPSLGHHPSFPYVSPSPSNQVPSVIPTNPSFQNFARPSNIPSFSPRPSPPVFSSRQHFPGPPRSFHSGPERPFYQQQTQSQSQSQTYFDEAKYLQENYHTITTDQINTPKQPAQPSRPVQNFDFGSKPSPRPVSPFNQEHQGQTQQLIPYNQQLPQQRPYTNFNSNQNKPSFPITPNRPPFYNLKPSPPQIEDNRQPFIRQPPQVQPQQQHQVNFHQGHQSISRPSIEITNQGHQSHNSYNGFSPSPSPSPSPSVIPQTQFLPQPSSTPFFSFNPHPSSTPLQNFHQQTFSSDRPQHSQSQTERPPSHQSLHDPSNRQYLQNVGQFVSNGGELVPSISKYEQHFTVNGPTTPNYNEYNNLQQSHSTASNANTQYHQQEQNTQQQQYANAEQEQLKQQLAQNVRKQQEEIQRLQSQLIYAQHQQEQQSQPQNQNNNNFYSQHQHQKQQQQQQQQPSTPSSQYVQERSRPEVNYVSSTESPQYYPSSTRTVEIKPSTQNFVSSTPNSVSSTSEPKKEEKKKPAYELPDEVPDDLRQQLLSSGILDNADISVLDYDKVGETPLESLPPDQLANFFSAGGGQQISASEKQSVFVKPNGDAIESRIDENVEDDEDQEIAASENVQSYVSPSSTQKQAVEMKVVPFDPKTAEGQKIASDYVKENAKQVDPVALNDKKYNRYLPLKVSGNQFPLPDILKGKKITSVVVLAPVETEAINIDHTRAGRAAGESLRGIKFIAGDSLHNLLKKPTKDNFEKWLQTEKMTATDQQSVILLVFGNEESEEDREIFMYDVASGNVSKLSGDLSNAFVDAAENNSLSKDIEKLAIEGEGTPEDFKNDEVAEGSENVPLFVDLSGVSLDEGNNNQISISTGYSKTKHGRSLKELKVRRQ